MSAILIVCATPFAAHWLCRSFQDRIAPHLIAPTVGAQPCFDAPFDAAQGKAQHKPGRPAGKLDQKNALDFSRSLENSTQKNRLSFFDKGGPC
jgi:hypothetical protein